MLEVEYKAASRDLDSVRTALVARGAALVGTERQWDRYYGHPVRDFAATDEALRVRTSERDGTTTSILTYKGVRLPGATRAREEAEVGLEGEIGRILEALSFRVAGSVRKTREHYRLDDGLLVTLDRVDGIGDYVEVETFAEPEGLETARRRVLDLSRALGLGPEETRSYLEMVLERQRGS